MCGAMIGLLKVLGNKAGLRGFFLWLDAEFVD